MSAATLDFHSPLLDGWTRVHPPTAQHPYWRDADAGSRLDVHSLIADERPEAREQAIEVHIAAVEELLREASRLHPIAEFAERRRLITAAANLCHELGGWRPALCSQPLR